jgi:hypothetical protein
MIPKPEKYPLNIFEYQMVIRNPKCPYNFPNDPKIYQHFPIYVTTSKIYPNRDFWFENKPSGNPG